MSEPKFTPGPWRVVAANVFRIIAPQPAHRNEPEGACPPYPWAIIADTEPASLNGDGPEAAANAILIAQAPELYRHLDWALDRLDALGNWKLDNHIAEARKVLATARGEKLG